MNKHPRIENAPGLRWRKRSGGSAAAVWVARADIVKRGYRPPTQRLWPPISKPDADFDAETVLFIQSECQRLQDDMLSWAHGGEAIGHVHFTGTIKSLIDCYRSDPDSPFHELRYQSRRNYSVMMRAIEATVGARSLAALSGRDFKRWYNNYCEDGAHVGRAHSRMNMIRILLLFGATILEDQHCKRLKAVISDMAFRSLRPRKVVLTAEQVVAIRRRAHEIGRPSIALAQAIGFDLMLRPKDIVGEWIPDFEPGLSAVTDRGRKWLYGIDWREVSPDLKLSHRLSKSLRGRDAINNPNAGNLKVFNLRLYSMVMEELAHVPAEKRAGPMIVDDLTGLPYRSDVFRAVWRRIANDVGVPKNVQNRDSRAGGITEGIKLSGGNIEMVRKSAGHSKVETTLRYSRQDEQDTADIAIIRSKRPGNAMGNGEN